MFALFEGLLSPMHLLVLAGGLLLLLAVLAGAAFLIVRWLDRHGKDPPQ
jgi:hypothetical protein